MHTAPRAQQGHGLREPPLVIDLSEADHIPTAATAVAVEEVFVGIHQEAWFVVSVQGAQAHPECSMMKSQFLLQIRSHIELRAGSKSCKDQSEYPALVTTTPS